MSRKSRPAYNLILALLVLIAVGGVLGVSSSNVKVSAVGSIIVMVSVLESVLIVGGIALLNRRQAHPGAAIDSS